MKPSATPRDFVKVLAADKSRLLKT